MTTQSIKWHINCLKCTHKFLKRKRQELADLEASVAKREQEFFHYAAQITKAKKLGKAGFDSERFMKKREKK